MKIDGKYIAFHVLTALYFIWFLSYTSLLFATFLNIYGQADAALNTLLELWIMLNFIMGVMLFMALRLFKDTTIIYKIIIYTFISISTMAGITLIISNVTI